MIATYYVDEATAGKQSGEGNYIEMILVEGASSLVATGAAILTVLMF